MKRWMRRSGLITVLASAVMILPGIANAATHTGTWNASAVTNQSVNTPMYVTTSTASGCAHGTLTAATFSMKLVWYNGGRDTVLWSGTSHCSPTKTIRGAHDPKVFLIITIHCNIIHLVCQGSGTWSITTN